MILLQWGRWFTPAETRPPTAPPAAHCRLQWGRWFTPAETPPPGPSLAPLSSGFNGAAGLHQRKPMPRRPPRRPAPRFNGAAGLHQRKLRPEHGHSLQRLAFASMGPLVYTSGNRPGVPRGGRIDTCFNGAAGLHQRKLGVRPQHVPGVLASMGPLVYTSGNTTDNRTDPRTKCSFNGAAGLHQRKRPFLCRGAL